MSQLLTSISKLSMDSGKDSAVCDCFVAKPKPELKSRLGTIVGIVELFGQPDEFVDKFFEIINDLETEYYLPPLETEGGIEKRFEECLQRANRRINKAINDSIIEIELKNINALVGLISRGRIYLSQIGQNNALLFHRKKKYDYIIIDIFSQAGDKTAKINKEKMFSNIINGVITEKDNLLFCNDSVLEYISQNELMEIITGESPASALKEIEAILKKESQNNNFYAIAVEPVVKESETGEESAVLMPAYQPSDNTREQPRVPSQNSINKLISTQENTEKYLAPGVAPNWKKALILVVLIFKVTAKFLYKYLKIGLIELFELLNDLFIYLKKNIPLLINKLTKKNRQNNNIVPEEDLGDGLLNKNDVLEIRNDDIKERDYSRPKMTGGLAGSISYWLNNQIAKFVSLKRLPQVLLVAVLILLFFFSQSMVWQGQVRNASEKTSAADLIKQIEDALNAGEAKNIFNDEAGAKESLQTAIDLMSQIPNSKKYQSDKEKLQQRIDELNKSLQKISYLDNPAVVSDLSNQNQSANISSISKSGNYIFAFDNQNQNIYKIDLAKKQTISRQLTGNFNNVRKITAVDENNIIALNGDSDVYKYDFEANAAENILTGNDKITDLALYGGKLYSLKSEKGQILKHLPVGTGYNSGSSWVKDDTDLSKSTAFTIDGGVYVIYENGDIKYLLNGKITVTNFSALVPPVSAPKQIFSDGDSSYLYALDQNNQRLIVFDKNSGNIKTQYSSKEFTDMKSMIIDNKEKKIYLLSDKKIYLIENNN
ncbi:MAG: hypothetical protein Q7K65_00910 [Candidatus Buchananbacteria bacterium]|nr:hypothetical protein [Candidatus Buchananbacteria bacterium]